MIKFLRMKVMLKHYLKRIKKYFLNVLLYLFLAFKVLNSLTLGSGGGMT